MKMLKNKYVVLLYTVFFNNTHPLAIYFHIFLIVVIKNSQFNPG